MTLTKKDSVDQIQDRLNPHSRSDGRSKQETARNVDTLVEIIRRTLERADDVLLSGFGKFQVKEKAERKGRNPATNSGMILPARRVVTFKSSGTFREKIDPPKPVSALKPATRGRGKS